MRIVVLVLLAAAIASSIRLQQEVSARRRAEAQVQQEVSARKQAEALAHVRLLEISNLESDLGRTRRDYEARIAVMLSNRR
jgi:hypothetical protein